MIKSILNTSRFITISLISILLLFVFSCYEEDPPTHPNPEQEEFNLKYTKCKISVYALVDYHIKSDYTDRDTTAYNGLNSKYAEGLIDDSDNNDYGGTFRGIYDTEGYSGTIVAIFKNEDLIESLTWSETYEGTYNKTTILLQAEEIDLSPNEPQVYRHTYANNLEVDCEGYLSIDYTNDVSGGGTIFTWTGITCDTKSYLRVTFYE